MEIEKPISRIMREWAAMERIPVMEFDLKNGETLVVDLALQFNKYNPGVVFEFDHMGLPTWFGGEVQGKDGRHRIRITQFSGTLGELLQQIYEEINEGFILSNDL